MSANLKQFIVTIKLPKDPTHDPRNKRVGRCPVSEYCTDVTGEHHSYLTTGQSEEAVRASAQSAGWTHITRIEEVW